MDELCQLCLKVGTKRKIKAIQVNLTEALWMCENEECLWPFGYEKPKLFSRRVGDKWAFEWQMYRKVQKTVGRIPVSAELSLYTPPVTPSGDVASKDSSKSDLVQVTSTSRLSGEDNVFSSDSAPRDSYAPGCSDHSAYTHEPTDAEEPKANVKIVSSQYKGDSTVVDQPPSLSSIFDIDGDKLLCNKFSTKPISIHQASFQSLGPPHEVTNSGPVDNQIDLVVEKAVEAEPTIEKTLQSKKIVTGAALNTDTCITRSIAKTNTNLKNCPPSKIVKKENIYPGATKLVEPPALSDISDNLSNPKQHTTTITVEGIPPITLSYDLADLGEKSEKLVPVTSTPIQRTSKRSVIPVENKDREERSKPLDELPKKPVNLPSKRRIVPGKKYEKFSFSALRKTVQETKECNEMKLNEVHRKKQEPLTSESRLGIVPLVGPMATSDSNEINNSNQTDESLILLNVDANNSNSVENLNLSCLLDDMLLDGCQNVSKNLNDDWLESFFT